MAGPADAPELLDVDVDQLAGHHAFVAVVGLRAAKTRQAPHSAALEDRGDGGMRHPERFGDLGGREAQLTQRADRVLAFSRRLVWNSPRCRGPIGELVIAVAVAAHPL
jgi:hypothetical protein